MDVVETTVLDLKDDLLLTIFQDLSLSNRASCACVCRRFKRIIVNSTLSIRHSRSLLAPELHRLQAWLLKHGGHITTLAVTPRLLPDPAYPHRWQYWRKLPSPKLQQLQLHCLGTQLAPHSGHPGLLQGCRSLTSLVLRTNRLLDTPADLAAVPALQQLRHLDVTVAAVGHSEPLPGCVLFQTQQLTHLRLAGKVSDGTLAHLSSCNNLQTFELAAAPASTVSAAVLQPLQHLTALTRLVLSCRDEHTAWSSNSSSGSSTPATAWQAGLRVVSSSTGITSFAQVCALQSLEVESVALFDPALLDGATQLTSLSVVKSKLQGGTAGVAALLAVLPQLQLQKLALVDCFPGPDRDVFGPGFFNNLLGLDDMQALDALADDDMPALDAPTAANAAQPSAADYAALTAGTQLEHLDLRGSWIPYYAWRHMFGPDVQLPQLRVLRASYGEGWAMQQLVSCCPGLQECQIDGELSNQELLELRPLSSLRRLQLQHGWREMPPALVQLTQLDCLLLSYTFCRDKALLPLTALKGLTQLSVDSYEFSDSLEPLDPKEHSGAGRLRVYTQHNQAGIGCPPDVWSQLQDDVPRAMEHRREARNTGRSRRE